MNALEKLQSIKHYRTDKYSMGYYPDYCFHFDRVRLEIKVILEIGVYRGASLELWRDYFPNAVIVGVDSFLGKANYESSDPRICVERGDVTDPKLINYLVGKYGGFDIVIDDGSHLASQMKQSFSLLWPYTKMIYCIDDLGTQYVTFKEGCFLNAPSMVEYLKELIDLNNAIPNRNTDYNAICFHRMQCYIYKK
jgi:hypothetical protein